MIQSKVNNKPKILFVVTEDWYFVSHRLPLAVTAMEAGFDVAVAARVGVHAETIRKAGIRLIPFEISRRIGNPLREILGLVFLYRRERPDVVHHVALKLVLYGSLAARLAGVSAQVNAVAGLGWLFISRNWIVRWVRPLIRKTLVCLLNASHCRVIVQNPDDVALLRKTGVLESNLRQICGSGVDIVGFSPVSEPPLPVCVVLATRLLWDKGVGEFVEAARQLKQSGTNARFILVGKPDPNNPASVTEVVLRAWQKEGIVECWGHREDMPTVFHAAHIVCLPSYREGLPKVLQEAAACGLPIVATDVPGCREVVREGENGLLVPARDAQALAKALIRLIEDSEIRAKMGRRSREIALAEFSSKHVNAQILDIYKEVLA
jgi:glycosyltransferase involved in cell wall biosynthesis